LTSWHSDKFVTGAGLCRCNSLLAADVVGYLRLMGKNEEKRLLALEEARREVADPNEHRGPSVKTTGDGLLAAQPQRN
jgi:adenylate cyclase